jgi:toxin YoeB
MEIVLLPDADNDLNFWKKTGNKPILKKIAQLIVAIKDSPFDGIGKPEPLKHSLAGCWSRRINHEHRIVYELIGNKILIHSLKGHYL